MKFSVILSLLFVSASTIAANNSSVITATNFYEALKTNQIGVARTLIIKPENLPDDGSTSFDISKYYFSKSNETKNSSIVETTTVNNKGTLSFNTVLEKVNGNWKIDFNKTILNMARGAVNKKQVGGKVEISIDKK